MSPIDSTEPIRTTALLEATHVKIAFDTELALGGEDAELTIVIARNRPPNGRGRRIAVKCAVGHPMNQFDYTYRPIDCSHNEYSFLPTVGAIVKIM